eukprot:GILJ01002410.1.p1 GENE.GILJ01002410.1~~GILJ01002410.1.p1  ORF type:complete len:122 (-),score=6.11 GILJ01002410.1:197-562(-)
MVSFRVVLVLAVVILSLMLQPTVGGGKVTIAGADHCKPCNCKHCKISEKNCVQKPKYYGKTCCPVFREVSGLLDSEDSTQGLRLAGARQYSVFCDSCFERCGQDTLAAYLERLRRERVQKS